jgi:hypothetical protein
MRALVYHGPGRKAWEEDIAVTTGLVDTSSTRTLTRSEGGEE